MGQRPKRSFGRIVIHAIGPAIVGVLVGWVFLPPLDAFRLWIFPPKLETVQILGEQEVVLRDKKGKSFGIIGVDGVISEAIPADVDNDGRKEIVIATGEGRTKPGHVLLFESDGTNLWDIDCYDETTMTKLGGSRSDHFVVQEMEVAEIFGGGKQYILVNSRDAEWFWARIMILDPHTGDWIANYWHPGQVGDMKVGDVNNDGNPDVLLSGLNNDLRDFFGTDTNITVAFAFTPHKGMNVQAVPWLQKCFDNDSALWYFALPPLSAVFTRLTDWDEDGMPDVKIRTRDGRFYYVDWKGEPTCAKKGDRWLLDHPGEPISPLYKPRAYKDTLEFDTIFVPNCKNHSVSGK